MQGRNSLSITTHIGERMIYTLKNEHLTVEINTLGAELSSVKSSSGHEFVWQGDAWKSHAPVLFPVCGRLLESKYKCRGKEYEMDKHGFASESEFSVDEVSDTVLTLSISANEKTLEIYPFDFTLIARYELTGNQLDLSFTVINTGKHTLPYMLGWHPAFTLPGEREIGSFYIDFGGKRTLSWHPLQNGAFVNPFYSSYAIKGGKYYLNEDEIYSNDTMIFKDIPESVKLSGGYQRHSVTVEYSSNLPYLCIWKAPESDARFICIEPWSDIPSDGETPENFDLRPMSRLSAGDEAEYRYSVTFE